MDGTGNLYEGTQRIRLHEEDTGESAYYSFPYRAGSDHNQPGRRHQRESSDNPGPRVPRGQAWQTEFDGIVMDTDGSAPFVARTRFGGAYVPAGPRVTGRHGRGPMPSGRTPRTSTRRTPRYARADVPGTYMDAERYERERPQRRTSAARFVNAPPGRYMDPAAYANRPLAGRRSSPAVAAQVRRRRAAAGASPAASPAAAASPPARARNRYMNAAERAEAGRLNTQRRTRTAARRGLSRCEGRTTAGTRCTRQTTGRFCFQHTGQASS